MTVSSSFKFEDFDIVFKNSFDAKVSYVRGKQIKFLEYTIFFKKFNAM